MADAQEFTGVTQVPNWMIRLATAFLAVLSAGAVATLSIVVHWTFENQRANSEVRSQVAAMEVKNNNFESAFNGLRKDITELTILVRSIKRDEK